MNRIVPIILAVALFMENMDSTVIATSLPAIAESIDTSPIALKLALTSYFVSLAIFIPISGWMADRFGATNIFRAAILVFILGSVACAFASSLEGFVIARFLQGVGGAMMTPIARLVLLRSAPRNQLVNAMAWLTVPALIGPIVGPPVGGFITTYFTWHWIFLINVPIGLLGIVMATLFLHHNETREPRPMDFLGFALSGVSVSGIIFGLSVISLPAIPTITGYIAVAVGVVAGALYIAHSRRVAFPLLDLRLFVRHRLFRNAIIGGSLFRIGIGAYPFLMPLMLQLTFGLNPLESGLTTFVAAVGAIISKPFVGKLYARFGFPRGLSVTLLLACAFMLTNAFFTPQTAHALLLASIFLLGLWRAFFFTGTNAFVFADISDAEASQATAISSVSQQISLALGVAVAGGVLEVSTNLRGAPLALVDFHTAWIVVSLISAVGVFAFLRLPPDAGSNVSGHRIERAE